MDKGLDSHWAEHFAGGQHSGLKDGDFNLLCLFGWVRPLGEAVVKGFKYFFAHS